MVFGIYSENASLDMQNMHRRELTIFGSSGCPWSMPAAINLIAKKSKSNTDDNPPGKFSKIKNSV